MCKYKLLDRLFLTSILLCITLLVAAEESVVQSVYLTEAQLAAAERNSFEIQAAFSIDSLTASGDKLMEFSGLAWDEDEHILYALSDRGFVIHLRPVFDQQQLIDMLLLGYYRLLDANGKALRHKKADSEGLALAHAANGVADDTQLIVSFERIPRVINFNTKGRYLATQPLPARLQDIRNFNGNNNALEAITPHPDLSLILGAEKPLKQTTDNLFCLNAAGKCSWSFAPSNRTHGSLVGLTTLKDGNLVALERSFPGLLAGITNTIHLFSLSHNRFQQQLLVELAPGDGVFNDNFEGITWHRSNRFFMISDDNDNLIQRTLLVYFALPGLTEALTTINKE